ncbi:MAG: hypothetical protein M0R46_13595 [Candidatus Muirbacterium halophilum]|nr:hypothetical protein [Candidatus Muirbacterium halophilum]
MLITETVKIKISKPNLRHYRQYYNNIKCGDLIDIKVEHLTKSSRVKVKFKCDKCGKEKEVDYKLYGEYGHNFPDYICRSCNLVKNNQEKYGVDNVFQLKDVKEKTKETNIKKYGVEYISQSSEIQDKIKETFRNKYGTDHPLQNKEFREQYDNVIKEKYGVDNVSQSQEIKDKKVETCKKNHGYDYISQDPNHKQKMIEKNIRIYGTKHMFQSEEIKEMIKKTNLLKYGYEYHSQNPVIKKKSTDSYIKTAHKRMKKENPNIIDINNIDEKITLHCPICKNNYIIGFNLYYSRRHFKTCICTNCNPIGSIQSGSELMLLQYIKSVYSGEIRTGVRDFGKELDIYLPELNLAFEFNGLYWHSFLHKTIDYHYLKTKMANDNGIDLYHIWEDDWVKKNNIILSMINERLNISPIIDINNLELKIVSKKEKSNFLSINHIHGDITSSVNIGLYLGSELVSLAIFMKRSENYELLRFCNKLGVSIPKALDKIINYFINNYNMNLTTIVDNSYRNSRLYEDIGFAYDKDVLCDFQYISKNVRVNKKELSKLNLQSGDLHRLIYDAGKIKYKYDNNKRNRG